MTTDFGVLVFLIFFHRVCGDGVCSATGLTRPPHNPTPFVRVCPQLNSSSASGCVWG